MALYHSAKGSVNYTVVGSPTIVDGILTNVDADNRVKIANLNLGSNSFEIGSKVKFSQQTATSYGVYGFPGNFLPIYIVNRTSFAVYIRKNSADNWSTITLPASMTPQVDIWYWWKVKHDGNGDYTFSVSTDEQNWVSATSSLGVINLSAADFLIGRANSGNAGAIDLNETYIKVNGQALFGVCPVEVKHIDYGTSVGYTKVGSPTISNGVASGFSSSDYIETTSIFSLANPFEVVVKATLPQSAPASGMILADIRGTYLRLTQSGSIGCLFGNVWCIKQLDNPWGNTYYFKVVKNSSGIATLYYSTDGESYTAGSSGAPIQFDTISTISFGKSLGYPSYIPWGGSIDLNETYIKVNGKLWFYQPAPTKYIVKDGKLVWADPLIYIDDNSTKTYATKDIAPVPAGYTYGNITTPSIGWVDMRTQQFTAAPAGATIGRDE